MAKLVGIAIRPPKSRNIRELNGVKMTKETGVVGDKRSRPGKRQVTLMSLQAWKETCRDLGIDLPWTTRRANLLVDELPLAETTGRLIYLGEAVLQITGETDPCRLMDEAQTGLLKALEKDWRGGVTCRVVEGGQLQVGMEVSMSDKTT